MCKTKLTPNIKKEIVGYIEAGNYIEVACGAVGIHKDTYYEWIKKGNAGKQPYADFADAIKKATDKAEIRNVVVIQKAAQENWQASAWYLERKHPDRWGKKETIKQEHSGTLEVKSIFQELADLQNVSNNEPTSGEDT